MMEEKKTKMTLKLQKEKYRSLVEMTDMGYVILDSQGQVLDANQIYANLTGRGSLKEVIGHSVLEWTAPYDRKRNAEEVRKCIEQGSVRNLQIDYMDHAGKITPVEIHATVLDGKESFCILSLCRDITERRRAEDLLRRSEERWRYLVDTSSAWIWETDSNMRHTYTNAFVTTCLGYQADEFLQLNMIELIHPDDHTILKELVQVAASQKKGWLNTVLRWRHKDGSWHFIETSGAPLFDSSNTFIGLHGVDHDITVRIKAEEMRLESEARFRELFETSRDGIAITDLSGRYLVCNHALLEMLGYDSIDQLQQKSHEELTPPEYHAFEAEVMANQTMKRGWSDEYEKEFICKTGERVPVRLRAWLRKNAEGQPLGCWVIVRDITERKQANEKLRESEESYRILFDQDPLPGWIYDIETFRFLLVNSAAQKHYGYTLEEFCSMTLKDIRPPEDVERLVNFTANIADQPSVSNFWTHLKKDGSLINVEIHSHPILFKGRNARRVIAKDVTESRRFEEALRTSEERFQLAMQGSNDGLWDWDMSTDEVYYSPRWKSMLGYAPDELEHNFDTWKRLVHPDDKNRTLNVVRSLLEGQSDKFEVEFRMQHKDGSFRHILSRAYLCHTAKAGHKRLVGTHVDITERKNMEQQLLESKKQLIQSQTVARIGHYVLDIRLGTWSSSEMIDELFGIGPEYSRSVEGWLNIVQPEQRQQILEYYTNHVIRDKQPFDREYQIIRVSDNAPLWVHGLGEVEYSDDGTPVRMFGTIQDITDRKRAEEAMRASAKMLQTIIDAEPECVKLLDENANLITMNRAGLDMIQADSLEQVNGQCICPLIASEYQQPFQDLTQRVFQGESGTLLFEIIGMKGRHLWLETHAVPLRNENNEIFALLGLTRDITDRKRAEEALRQSEQFIRSILDTVDEGFIVVDRDYRILTANKAYCSQVGRCSEDIIGQHCYEISHKTSRPCYEEGEECATRQAFETGRPHAALHRHRDANGNIIYVDTKAFPLKDASGAVISVIETINNITEKYLLEEERLKTQKLESIGRLAGGIAHDFNNLLQGVFGYISMAKLTYDQKEKSLAMLEQAEKALHLSVNLTTQLLTFSRGGKPVKKLIRLEPEIENAVKFALSGSKIDYRLDIASELWPVEADAGQLAQVIQNMVLNADEAMAGGGTVTITVSNMDIPSKANPRLPRGGRFVRIDIQDTGIGISVQNMSKIFDPYFTTKQKGSGLGLATSYSIIKNHGGLIEVKSEQNRGTTFSIYLPAIKGAEVTVEPTATVPATTKKLRVLLMDDEDFVRSVAQEMLKVLGHEVEYAENGERAIELFSQARDAGRPFDLVILDLTVKGGMGGEKAIAKIRDIDPNVKAVVSSGYADNPVVADYRAYGFSAVLSKPYRLEALRSCLNLFLS